jgi:hypothetical protein
MSLYVACKHGFDVIHAHNPPDTLFLVAALYKPFGKKFIFDHHDLSPELYQSRYGANNNLITQVLRLMEKCSLELANVTIATNESYETDPDSARRRETGEGFRSPERAGFSADDHPFPKQAAATNGQVHFVLQWHYEPARWCRLPPEVFAAFGLRAWQEGFLLCHYGQR